MIPLQKMTFCRKGHSYGLNKKSMIGCPALSPKQLQLALRNLNGQNALRNRALVMLGVRSGLRISELLAPRVDQVWDGTKVVDRFYIRRHATKGKEAGASIVMHPEAAQFLFRWIKAGKLSGDPHGYPSFKQEEIDRAILSI